ncbi:MAG TPA: alpha-galactosidase [Anaerohalosphaeraceae bacterium]|jgi:alpha-galactosidase|nr:alpha-galactosidase [Anaerohalosphaeraceae bacterium]HRT50271.1 alpha-galactosidase [Anaerohalosphaeraceae bacterium]HRT86208.1 alpha-galactosidase [Anaerohalosphaeraceae bacterium]
MIDLIDGVKYRKICSLVCLFWVFVSVSAWALEDAEIPVDAPQDAIMASAEEVQAMLRWASAAFCEGLEVRGGEERPSFMTAAMPFSFVYDGVSSAELLKDWRHSVETKETPGRVVHTAAWTDPKTGLRITAVVTVFTRYAAADWLLFFENTGAQDTPIIENVQALDVRLRTGYGRKQVVLHRLTGDVCGEQSFLPLETVVEVDKPVEFAPTGGRPSNGAFPFFNVRYGEEGVFTAIGWSGQWAARLNRESAGPVRLQAGMERTHFKLHPGERVRSPRILVMPWKGEMAAGHNRFRRLLLFEYAPRLNGRPLRLPLGAQCFDRYSRTVPEWATEAGQLRAVRATHDFGCDTYWFDAAWFEGGFPDGVGNWFCKPRSFPNGLKPLGDASHALGLKFLVWFEPERVVDGTQIAREHPEFVFGNGKERLFKLSDPAARRWLTEMLSERIREFGIDVYRNDFNIDPLEFWRAADSPDRQGITEIRYVEGHYAMWDELRRRHPGLWIDNCSSGGRRIDLETLSRSVTLWRSDTGCAPGHADWDQTQALGLSQYVPLYTTCAWEPKAYVLRSAATGGLIVQFDYLNETFPMAEEQAAIAEIKENQKYWYGDFYPLTQAAIGPDVLAAWQLHRADLDAGMVLAFRRSACPISVLKTNLHGLKEEGRYVVEFVDEARARQSRTLTGRQLRDLELRLPERGTSLLVRYHRLDQ